MKVESELPALKNEVFLELTKSILPYWLNKVYDDRNASFHGRIDAENRIHHDADRSAVLISRIAYSFAASFQLTGDSSLVLPMQNAVNMIERDFFDHKFGGLFWMTDASGSPIDTKKHVYAQSFGIYAYATVFAATNDKLALQQAIKLFELIESHAFLSGSNAYHEAFSREWSPLSDVRLGDSDALEPRSTNTHLHLLEAYAALYKGWPNEVLKARIAMLIEVFLSKIYNQEGRHFYSFFDENWTPKSQVYSFGHDIETVWLLLDAARAINQPELIVRCEVIALEVANMVLDQAIDSKFGGIYNFGSNGVVVDTEKHWWAQAEAMVGLLMAYRLSGDVAHLNAVFGIWEFITKHVIDHVHGEWYFRVNRNGSPIETDDKVGAWKCPYHTSRACIQIYNIINEIISVEITSESVQK